MTILPLNADNSIFRIGSGRDADLREFNSPPFDAALHDSNY